MIPIEVVLTEHVLVACPETNALVARAAYDDLLNKEQIRLILHHCTIQRYHLTEIMERVIEEVFVGRAYDPQLFDGVFVQFYGIPILLLHNEIGIERINTTYMLSVNLTRETEALLNEPPSYEKEVVGHADWWSSSLKANFTLGAVIFIGALWIIKRRWEQTPAGKMMTWIKN